MPSQRLTVSVPQPCHEAWHAMTPQGQGRFCQSCSKTVTDFTAMSDVEVVKWLSQHKDSIYGRFKKDQIYKELMTVSSHRNKLIWRVLIMILCLSTWLGAYPVEARIALPTSTSLYSPTPETASTDSIKMLKGTVLDSASKEPMPGVSIYWKGTSIGVSTNAEGKFNLAVLENQIPSPQILVLTYIGYLKQEISLKDLLTNQNPVIGLSPDLISRVEIVIPIHCATSPGHQKIRVSPTKKE